MKRTWLSLHIVKGPPREGGVGQILGESHGFYENRREDQPLLTATKEGGS